MRACAMRTRHRWIRLPASSSLRKGVVGRSRPWIVVVSGSSSPWLSTSSQSEEGSGSGRTRSLLPDENGSAPTLKDFIAKAASTAEVSVSVTIHPDRDELTHYHERVVEQMFADNTHVDEHEHEHEHETEATPLTFHLKTYGCQMNVSDSDVVRSILLKDGMVEGASEDESDVVLTNTCAIRENAENKIWHRLRDLKAKSTSNHKSNNNNSNNKNYSNKKSRTRIVGVLGCMAERLKADMFRDGLVDLIAGPDAYRDLPRLIRSLTTTTTTTTTRNPPSFGNNEESSGRAINVRLSLEETYGDINPVRADPDDVSAFVSVMRGCNNMCSYCVVPFTRGRERSRDLPSIVDEVRRLLEVSADKSHGDGVKEVVLLGQNVNSYHDKSGFVKQKKTDVGYYAPSNEGFSNLYKLRDGPGHRFVDLVASVADLHPELRVRFTSPHPKDYPPELLQLMAERHNVCNQLHLPVQSGSSTVLQRMRRGYDREAYLRLVDDVRTVLGTTTRAGVGTNDNDDDDDGRPDVGISTDIIAGFCGETEDEHADTVSLLQEMRYDQAFLFAYSERAKTHAHRTLVDDVDPATKSRRLQEIIDTFRTQVHARNAAVEVGRLRVVLVEGPARTRPNFTTETTTEPTEPQTEPPPLLWTGRTDQNKRILFRGGPVANHHVWSSVPSLSLLSQPTTLSIVSVPVTKGSYVVVEVTEARGHTLRGRALCRTTLKEWNELGLNRAQEGQLLRHLHHGIDSNTNVTTCHRQEPLPHRQRTAL